MGCTFRCFPGETLGCANRHQVTFSEAALERVEEAVLSGEIVNIDEKQLAPSKPVWVPKISI